MKTHTGMLGSINFRSTAHRQAGERQARTGRRGAERATHALRSAYWTFAVVLALGSSLVHAQVPTCAAPGCNSVTSDSANNTAMGTQALASGNPGNNNTVSGYQALFLNAGGNQNTASGVYALFSNSVGGDNAAFGYLALLVNSSGYQNTAIGSQALNQNTLALDNTAVGFQALYFNNNGGIGGNNNTATGAHSLFNNTTGDDNVASGVSALEQNTSADGNTATGYQALQENTTGASNSAFGYRALQSNVTGTWNIASGSDSLHSNTSGDYNSAYGVQALYFNTTASNNTASGYRALYKSTTGIDNTAAGFAALLNNTTGNGNTAVGYNALNMNTTGLNNIAIGNNAGYSVTDSNNIEIGNPGIKSDSGTIRIGANQARAYIAGIYDNTSVSGLAVIVDSNGQLGTAGASSSERFKTDIEPMGSNSGRLQQLRPVKFRYKADAQGTLRYGLIAEEVAKVYPELVVRNQNGRIDGVRYDELAPLLLNELQQQQRINSAQAAQIRELKGQVKEINDLKQEMRAALLKLQKNDQLVAKR